MTQSQLIKKLNLRFNEHLNLLNDSDSITVTRTTKGNFLPGHTQRMTVQEAKNYGAWDSCRDTMEYSIKTDSGESVNQFAQFVYYIAPTAI